MKKSLNISFIGAGEIGQAISALVSHTGAHVEKWDADLTKVPDQKSLQEVVASAHVLFFCVPSWVLDKAIKSAVPFLSKKTVCVFVSKGIDKTHLFMDKFVAKTLPKQQPFVLLSGPMLAEELLAGKGGAAIIASSNTSALKTVYHLFSCNDLMLTQTKEVHSVAVSGVLKNVYAIGLGIASGLDWGDNKKGWLCVCVVREMQQIMKWLKCDTSFALHQSGLGDFIATGFSRYSSNQTLGRELVEKSHCERKSEGCVSLPALVKLLGAKRMKQLPVLSALNTIIQKGKNVKDTFDRLFCEI